MGILDYIPYFGKKRAGAEVDTKIAALGTEAEETETITNPAAYAATDKVYNIDDYGPSSGRIVGEDGRAYNLVDLFASISLGGGYWGNGGGVATLFWRPILSEDGVLSFKLSSSREPPEPMSIFSPHQEKDEGGRKGCVKCAEYVECGGCDGRGIYGMRQVPQLMDMSKADELPDDTNLNNLSAGTKHVKSGQALINVPPEYTPDSAAIIHTTIIDGRNAHQEIRIQNLVNNLSPDPELESKITAGDIFELSNMTVGAVVRLQENREPHAYRIAHQGIPSGDYIMPENSAILIRDRVMPGREMNSADVNDYENSTIHQWLNSEYLNMFNEGLRRHLIQVQIPFRPGEGSSSAISTAENGLHTWAFLLSSREAGNNVGPALNDGAGFALFSSNNTSRVALNDRGSAVWWWLRSPHIINLSNFWVVSAAGAFSNNSRAGVAQGIRPAIVLPGSLLVSASGDLLVPDTTSTNVCVLFRAKIDGLWYSWARVRT